MADFFVVSVGRLHVLFTLADRIKCIHMPIVRFLRYPEGQFKQQLCNIGFGRSDRLKGKVITWVLLKGFGVKMHSIAESTIIRGLCFLSCSMSISVACFCGEMIT